VDEKARANVVAITIAFSVLVAGLSFLAKDELNAALGQWWVIATVALVIVGVLSLICGGLMALEALHIGPVYSPGPEDESGVAEGNRVLRLLWRLKQNEKTGLLRTNALSVGYGFIRNGVFILAVVILLLASRALLVAVCRPD